MCDTFENHKELDDRHKDWKNEKAQHNYQENLRQVFENCPSTSIRISDVFKTPVNLEKGEKEN